MNDVVTSPTPSIFAEGAPTGTAQNGTRYFDTTASPYAEYVYFAGAWQGPLGAGGSGSGLPYTAVPGPPDNWYVYAPYNFNIYCGSKYFPIPYKDFGGNITLAGGYGYTSNMAGAGYGGAINLRGGYGYGPGQSFGGDIRIFGGAAYGPYGYGGDVSIGSGYGSAYYGRLSLFSYGDFAIFGLPIINPGGSGIVWNNGGVLTIT